MDSHERANKAMVEFKEHDLFYRQQWDKRLMEYIQEGNRRLEEVKDCLPSNPSNGLIYKTEIGLYIYWGGVWQAYVGQDR